MYPEHDLTQAKYDLLKSTNMTDYTAQLWKESNDSDDVPEEFTKKREAVLANLQKLEEDSQKVLSVLEDQEVVSALRQDKTQNLQYLKEHHGVLSFAIGVDLDYRGACKCAVSIWTVAVYYRKLWCSCGFIVSFQDLGIFLEGGG